MQFSELQRPRDLDLESSHTAYCHASLIDLYAEVRTDVTTDGRTFPPLTLLGRLEGVDLKMKYF